jgi:hypothetical protein
MESWFAHTGGGDPARAEELPGPGRPLTLDDSADCCPARPVVTVIMPPASGRSLAADLRMCGHHYRVSSATLRAAGATTYDATGAVIAPGDDGRLLVREQAPPRRPQTQPAPPARGRRMTPPA